MKRAASPASLVLPEAPESLEATAMVGYHSGPSMGQSGSGPMMVGQASASSSHVPSRVGFRTPSMAGEMSRASSKGSQASLPPPAALLRSWPQHHSRMCSSLYEQACRQRSILPKFIRAAHEGCLGRELDLSSVSLGDLQLEALLCDAALVPADKVTRWRLRDIRVSAQGLAALVKALSWETEVLNLSRNDLGLRGVTVLADRMSEARLPRLRSLDLSSCGVAGTALSMLCASLLQCPFLLRLDLNHNSITDVEGIGEMLADHTHLSRLALNNNFLTARGVVSLFRGVLENSRNGGQLADLGLAWNGFGKPGALPAAEAISEVLAASVTLYHLDLSYNGLDAACCAAIGSGLKDNHHLYGLHLVGNAATMDADGFLQPLCNAGEREMPMGEAMSLPGQLRSGDPHLFAANCLAGGNHAAAAAMLNTNSVRRSFSRRHSDPAVLSSATAATADEELSEDTILRERDDLEQKSTCWACEGWTRVELEWDVPTLHDAPDFVWAFTSLDGFSAALSLRRLEVEIDGVRKVRFVGARMVPGGCKLGVIFQVDGKIRIAPNMGTEALANPADVRLRGRRSMDVVKVHEMGVINCPISPGQGQDKLHGQRTVLLDGPDGCPVQMLRVTESEHRRLYRRQSTSITFFATFEKETAELLGECLTEDWSKAKVGRIVSEQDWPEVQMVLKESYRKVVAIYRLISTLGVASETSFGVNQIELSDLVSKAGLIDTRTRIADVDRLFIAAKVANLEMKRGPAVKNDKALARHQFLEFLLRLADQRYIQSGDKPNLAEALRAVLGALNDLGEALVLEIDTFFEALHTEASDEVYKRHRHALQLVYKEFSGKNTKPGALVFMSLSEFQELLDLMEAHNADFPHQRSGFAFRLGMMTQAEETYSSRFQEMSFLEFQHALGAVVFLRSKGEKRPLPELIEEFFNKRLPMALHGGRARATTSGQSGFGML